MMLCIDGSYGEGGGQILRTALALALVTGQTFRIDQIRAGRKKPGLMRQHLAAVNAAAEIGGAELRGNVIGSQRLTFAPRAVLSGKFHHVVGSAGSCSLVLQAILPALLIAEGPSEIVLEGGTHNPCAPPFEFLQHCLLPLLERMGPRIEAVLEKPGFFPGGGGRIRVMVSPSRTLAPLALPERGTIRRLTATAAVSRLPLTIAHRELGVVGRKLGLTPEGLQAVEVRNALGPGNVVTIAIESEALTEVVTGFGHRGIPAEKVAARAAREVLDYLAHQAPVGPHLADQLLVPMAIAGQGCFRTGPPSRHTLTNIDVFRQFVEIACRLGVDSAGRTVIELGKIA